MNDDTYRPWMRTVLFAAAAYNLVWGFWVIARPLDMFQWTGIDTPIYAGIWQCVGMIVGVYGIGYAIAATNPLRHWPIVLVGFLGKVFGPIGMLQNVLMVPEGTPGRLPASWLWLNLTNDLIWLVPFALILYAAFRQFNAPESRAEMEQAGEADFGGATVSQANRAAKTNQGPTLAEMSRQGNVLVVFLRHSGCTFCREALADLSSRRAEIERDASIVLVHMAAEDADSQAYFDRYAMGDVARISDPACRLYRAYELGRGGAGELLGPRVWWRGFKAAILAGHAVGKLGGDGFQMPGAFLVRDDQIVKAFRHQTAADRPDYCELAATS